MNVFGYDPERPAPALLRVAGLAGALYGVITENTALIIVGLVVGFSGMLMGWVSTPDPVDEEAMESLSDDEFEQQLADYKAGKRKTLPGQ